MNSQSPNNLLANGKLGASVSQLQLPPESAKSLVQALPTETETRSLAPAPRGAPARFALIVGIPLIVLALAAIQLSNTQALQTHTHALSKTVGYLLQSPMFWLAVAVGFSAQAIDGALGMAYGISSTTFLMGVGASPAAASAAVHIAEVFTTGLSGASHWKFGNVDPVLFKRLVIPGALGSVVGAYVLTSIDGNAIKPFVSAYLLLLGLYILVKAWRNRQAKSKSASATRVGALAVSGGFLDAAGGGGWGPVVTSTLVSQGNDPRKVIGTVNSAEFFISLAAGGAFLLFGNLSHGELIAGLVVGGLFAAPMAAYMTRKLPPRTLLWLVGALITLISTYNLFRALQ